MKQQVSTPPPLREASRKVVSQNSGVPLQFRILNHTVLVFAKSTPHMHYRRRFYPFLMLCFLQYRLSSYRTMASPAQKTAEEGEDTDYDPGTSGSEAGTPKKGRKKKETPDPGLTLGTDIEDHLKPDGRQVEVELDNVRIDQEKTKGQIRRRDAKLLQKRIESLEAAPPTGPLHVVLWEDNSMLPTDCSLFSLREPSRKDVSHICRWRLLVCIWTAQRGSGCEDSGEATHRVSGSAAVAYYMHCRYSKAYDTVGLPCKAGGTSTRKRTRR